MRPISRSLSHADYWLILGSAQTDRVGKTGKPTCQRSFIGLVGPADGALFSRMHFSSVGLIPHWLDRSRNLYPFGYSSFFHVLSYLSIDVDVSGQKASLRTCLYNEQSALSGGAFASVPQWPGEVSSNERHSQQTQCILTLSRRMPQYQGP